MMCTVCKVNPAKAFVRRSRFDPKTKSFVPNGVDPICNFCLTRRNQMVGEPTSLPWEESLAEWTVQSVMEQ